jgi:hypothetical protein
MQLFNPAFWTRSVDFAPTLPVRTHGRLSSASPNSSAMVGRRSPTIFAPTAEPTRKRARQHDNTPPAGP